MLDRAQEDAVNSTSDRAVIGMDPHKRSATIEVVITAAGQRIHVGLAQAGRTVAVESGDHTFRVYDGNRVLTEVPRTTTKDIARFKIRKPEPPRRPARRQPDAP